jgi:RND family efflux transporter MFP subunit
MSVALKIVAFIALIAVIVLAAKMVLKEREPESVPSRKYVVKRMDIEQSVYGSGVLRCSKRAELASQAAGKIRELAAEEGDAVKSSQVLCKMSNDKLENELAKAQKDYQFANDEYQDKKRTHEQGLPPSESELKKLEWELEQKQIDLKPLDEKVKALTLASPLTGTVLKSYLKKNEISLDPEKVYPEGTPLFVIGDLSSLAVSGTILESDVGKVKEGFAAVVQCGKKGWLPAKVTRIDLIPTASSEGGRYGIHLDFAATPSEMNEGVTVDFRIIVGKKSNVIAVPVEYVEAKEGRHWVKKIKGEKKIRVPIEVGISSDAFYEVTKGLKEGDIVVWEAATEE